MKLSNSFKLPNQSTLPNPVSASVLLQRPASSFYSKLLRGTIAVFFALSALYVWKLSPFSPSPYLAGTGKLITATHGAVASENEICSQIGVNIMKKGGNAVDSAISAVLCVGVVNMFSSGIGGGGFMVIRIPPSNTSSSSVYTVDFRETAPSLSAPKMFVSNPIHARIGALSVAVPSELKGLAEAHRRWGSLKWEELVMPSVRLARNGWRVQKELAGRMEIEKFSSLILTNPVWRATFAPGGVLLKEGDIIRRVNLSNTLERVAREGAEAFYREPIATSILTHMSSLSPPGILTLQDMQSYTPIVSHALQGTFRGKKLYTPHAPSSGGVLIHILNLMERYTHTEETEGTDHGNEPLKKRTELDTHRMVESIKFGFAARTKVCDPAFDYNGTLARIGMIPTKEYAAHISKNLTDDTTHPPDYYSPEYTKMDHGTSHTSVVDSTGMAVSITSTINLVFGSQVLDPTTGVILNDEMDDFSIPGVPNAFGLYPSPYNYPSPRKRPLSSTAPTIIENEDGSLNLVVGGAGGSRIFPSVFQVILNLLEWPGDLARGRSSGMVDVSQAIERGRLHNQLYPEWVDIDRPYDKRMLEALRSRGHKLTFLDPGRTSAVVQAIVVKDGKLYAASDSRKNGVAAGY